MFIAQLPFRLKVIIILKLVQPYNLVMKTIPGSINGTSESKTIQPNLDTDKLIELQTEVLQLRELTDTLQKSHINNISTNLCNLLFFSAADAT